MPLLTSALAFLNGYKTFSSVILAVLSGLGMILTRGLGWGISEIFQALTLVFSGVAAIGLKIAVAELSALAQAIQGSAAGTGTTPAAKAS